jgi:hypothetical protein
MKTTTYRGCTLTQTENTTDVTRFAFGRRYQTIARVWDVDGRVVKSACAQPFLTSARECRQYIAQELGLREWERSPDYQRYIAERAEQDERYWTQAESDDAS